MDAQRDTINTQRIISDNIMEQSQEKFAIAVSADDTNKNRLAIQVKNLGTNPVEVGDIWIINNSGNFPAKKYLIDYKDSIIPSGYGSNILDSTPLFMNVDNYDIKVVSTLGTIEKSELTIGAGNNLRATLLAIPPEVKVGQNVTLTMHVENIGNTRLLNVAPVNDSGKLHPNISPEFTTPHPTPPQPVDLDPGEGVFFTWKYVTTGAANTLVDFNANATATEDITGFSMKSNTAYEEIELKTPDVTEVIVLTEDLISRPAMFLTIPAPFGDCGNSCSDEGLWGMNVVNPTAQPMNVSKIVISAIVPRSNPGDKMFTAVPACDLTPISPLIGTWDCPSDNQLVWEMGTGPLDDPQIIPPFSVYPFLATVEPGSVSTSSISIEATIIHGNVFTSVGQFGKAGYGSSMDFFFQAIANVYLSDVKEGIGITNMMSNVSAIVPNTLVRFNATIAEFDTNVATSITDGELIVNIPKGWGVPTVIDSDGFNLKPILSFSDGSHQIIGTLTDVLDGTPGDVARTIQFDSLAPDVSSTQMYVMYILANGITNDDYSVSPLAEVILQVTP